MICSTTLYLTQFSWLWLGIFSCCWVGVWVQGQLKAGKLNTAVTAFCLEIFHISIIWAVLVSPVSLWHVNSSANSEILICSWTLTLWKLKVYHFGSHVMLPSLTTQLAHTSKNSPNKKILFVLKVTLISSSNFFSGCQQSCFTEWQFWMISLCQIRGIL